MKRLKRLSEKHKNKNERERESMLQIERVRRGGSLIPLLI